MNDDELNVMIVEDADPKNTKIRPGGSPRRRLATRNRSFGKECSFLEDFVLRTGFGREICAVDNLIVDNGREP